MNRDPDAYQWCIRSDSIGAYAVPLSHAARERYDCSALAARAVRALCGVRYKGVEALDVERNRCEHCLGVIKGVLKAP